MPIQPRMLTEKNQPRLLQKLTVRRQADFSIVA